MSEYSGFLNNNFLLPNRGTACDKSCGKKRDIRRSPLAWIKSQHLVTDRAVGLSHDRSGTLSENKAPSNVPSILQSRDSGDGDNKILDCAELKPWLLSEKPRESRVHIYLVRFTHAITKNALTGSEHQPSEFDSALLSLPNDYLGSACYRITESDYLIVDAQNQVEYLETLTVETRGIQIQQSLLEHMAAIDVVGFVQGEIVEEADHSFLYTYLRGFRKLLDRISDIAKSDGPDYQILNVNEEQTESRGWVDHLPDYLPIVDISTGLEIVAFEMLAKDNQPPASPDDTNHQTGRRSQETRSSSIIVRNAVMALSLLRKEEILETRLNIQVSFGLVRDGTFGRLLDEISRKTGRSLNGLDFEIYGMPGNLHFGKETKAEFQKLRTAGHKLILTDPACLFDIEKIVHEVTVDCIKADQVINNNLHNPLIADILSRYVEQARLSELQLHCAGVDSEYAFRKIKRLGVTCASGTYFGPSEKIDTIFKKIRKVLDS